MIREYIEKNAGKITDEEFNFAGRIVKKYILEELGGSAKINLVQKLMLDIFLKRKA